MNDGPPRPEWALPATDLRQKTVLVVGGAGGVGEGVVRTLLSTGATVVAAGRGRERLDDLATRTAYPRLAIETVDALDPNLADRAAELAGRHGSFDGVADIPFPGSAGVAVAAAARKSLTRTIAAEIGGSGPRVYGVILGMVRTRPRQLAGIDDPRWIPASDVGWHVAELVAGTSPVAGDDLHYFVDASAGPRREAAR